MPSPLNPQAPSNSGLTSADGRRIEVELTTSQLRALGEVLKPGSTVSGRVLEQFANGAYLFALRGRNLIAQSHLPLARDSVVQFQVLQSGDGPGGITLRLLDSQAKDGFSSSIISDKLRHLGLPNNEAMRQAMALFEEADAPLQSAGRLRQAAEAWQTQGPRLAMAHALIAKHGLPVTPLTLQLALRAVDPRPTNLAAHLQGLPNNLARPANTAHGTTSLATTTQPTSISSNPNPAAATPAASNGTAAPTASNQAPPSVALAAATSTTRPTTAAATTAMPSSALPAPAQASATPSTAPTSGPTGSAETSARPATSAAGNAGSLATTPNPNLPAASSNAPNSLAANSTATSIAGAGSAASTFGGSTALTNQTSTGWPAVVSEVGNGQRQEVEQALHHSGLKPMPNTGEQAPGNAQTTLSTPEQEIHSLFKHLAILGQLHGDGDHSVSVHQTMREAVAETLFKPTALADYDTVLPLAISNQQQPTPARLAIAQRHSGSTTATFIRVDMELAQLGPVSARLNDLGLGSLSITVFASGRALTLLRAEQAAIENDLQAMGIDSALRIADLQQETRDHD